MICISWHFFLIYILTAPIKFASYWHTRFLNHSQFHFLVKILFDGYLLFSRNIYIYIFFSLIFHYQFTDRTSLSFTLQIFSNCASFPRPSATILEWKTSGTQQRYSLNDGTTVNYGRNGGNSTCNVSFHNLLPVVG